MGGLAQLWRSCVVPSRQNRSRLENPMSNNGSSGSINVAILISISSRSQTQIVAAGQVLWQPAVHVAVSHMCCSGKPHVLH